MSEPTIWTMKMPDDTLSKWVKWEDYARLKAEVERLTERNKFLEQIDSYLQGANENAYEKRCDELEAEVELWKLRSDNWQKLCQIAKEGKQP